MYFSWSPFPILFPFGVAPSLLFSCYKLICWSRFTELFQKTRWELWLWFFYVVRQDSRWKLLRSEKEKIVTMQGKQLQQFYSMVITEWSLLPFWTSASILDSLPKSERQRNLFSTLTMTNTATKFGGKVRWRQPRRAAGSLDQRERHYFRKLLTGERSHHKSTFWGFACCGKKLRTPKQIR